MFFNKEIILIIFPSLLISALPLLIITGPFLSDLSIVLVSILFLINVFINKDYLFLKNKFFIIFLFFFFYLVINSIIKYYDFHNLRTSIGYLRFGLYSLGVFYFLEKKPEIIKWLFFVFLFCFTILIIDGYLQYFFKTNYLNVMTMEGRISSLFGSKYVLGSYLSRLFPIFLGVTFYLFKNDKKIITIVSVLFILIEVLIFLSGERASFFFNSLAAIFIILMIKDFKLVRFYSLIISLLLIGLISTFDSSAKKRIINHTIDQIGFKSEKIYIFSEVHESHYRSAYKMFLDNKVMGIGVRNFRNFCSEEKFYGGHERACSTHPHNTYIQLLSETGIIGFSFILILLLYFTYNSIKHLVIIFTEGKYYFNNLEVCLLAAVLISLWPITPSGNFFNNWNSIIYYFPIGFLLWSLDKSKKNQEN